MYRKTVNLSRGPLQRGDARIKSGHDGGVFKRGDARIKSGHDGGVFKRWRCPGLAAALCLPCVFDFAALVFDVAALVLIKLA